MRGAALWIVLVLCASASGAAQAVSEGRIAGRVIDETGGALPGVVVELVAAGRTVGETVTNDSGEYALGRLAAARYQLSFTLANFAPLVRRDVRVGEGATIRVNVTMQVALSAEVTVTRKRTFANLADVDHPAEDLVGIAQSASQGAMTARELDARPLARVGEILETIPGVIISQHSGEGKANQYFLRGFNLDHGTDFATTVAGIPVNMPTHAHGHGYSDLNFMIPELVGRVQFSKGPYFAEQGDFATAGSATIEYASVLERPLLTATAGAEGYRRALAAASPRFGDGHLLVAFEANANDGPWVRSDAYRKVNGVVRYSAGDALNGLAVTAMAYEGRWHATDQIPARGVANGTIERFGTMDPSDGGHSARYSASIDWQRGGNRSLTRVGVYGVAYDLHLFSNFTYFLDDPVRGDQFEQADGRLVTGGRVTHQRFSRWNGRAIRNTFGVQVRNDAISNLGLYRTVGRARLDTRAQASVGEMSGALFAQSEVAWSSWLRTLTGVRGDQFWLRVNALDRENSGSRTSGLVSPKAAVVLGPWRRTEVYVNAGGGYHSNDARGATIRRDADGQPVERVTPLVRARAAEVGVRSVAGPHLQSTVTLWTLGLASELLFVGDAGTTTGGRPSSRRGVEWTNHYTPTPWLAVDGDLSWSRALHRRERLRESRSWIDRNRVFRPVHDRRRPRCVRQPAMAVLRATIARRRRIDRVAIDQPVQSRGRIQGRQPRAFRRGCLQPAECR